VQHVLATLRDSSREIEIGKIAFDEFHTGDVIQVAALPGDERVGYSNTVVAPNQLLR
jgi:hypothetical protein